MGGIPMRLHLWHLCLHLLLYRCGLCCMRISPPPLALDLTMSFWPPSTSTVVFLPLARAPPLAPTVVTAAPAPTSPCSSWYLRLPLPQQRLFDLQILSSFPKIKDVKAYLDLQDLIQFYLCLPKYFTKRSDNALITSPSNLTASLFWEVQLRVAVREGSLRFLVENYRTLYHGKGFEMLAALEEHCSPDTV
jgi:hypothetical protein